jgi:hypothetical protein
MPVNHELPPYVPATPEYVLAVFRDQYRQDCSIEYDAEPQLELTFETTIAEWRFWCTRLVAEGARQWRSERGRFSLDGQC